MSMKITTCERVCKYVIMLLTFILFNFVSTVSSGASLKLAAVIKSKQTAVLSSQIDGVVKEVNALAGDTFREGDVLVSLDCALQQAAVNRAKAQLEYTRSEYKSNRTLENLNSTTKVQVALSAAEFAKAKAELEVANHRIRQCVVVAPFDGTVVQSWVSRYESVNTRDNLMQIVNNHSLNVEFLAPSNELKTLKRGREVHLVVSENDKTYKAFIEKVIPYVDSVSKTVKVIARLKDSNDELWAGMSGILVID